MIFAKNLFCLLLMIACIPILIPLGLDKYKTHLLKYDLRIFRKLLGELPYCAKKRREMIKSEKEYSFDLRYFHKHTSILGMSVPFCVIGAVTFLIKDQALAASSI